MTVAFVILNWNGCEMLRTFLPTVVEYSMNEGIEIWVADNGSKDGSIEMLKKEFPKVRLIILTRNYGFAEGYNRALKQIEARYYVLLNSDVEVTSGWLLPLLSYMDAHPEVAACQPKLLSWKDKNYFEYAGACGGFMDWYGYPFCRGRIFDTVEKDKGQYEEICSLFWASGAALFIRSDAYWEVGGLDGRFFAHMEEIDLCWRLRSRSYKIVCIPESRVYHVGGATLQKENPRKVFLNFRNNLVMLYKNLPEEELKKVMRIRKILDYLAVLIFLIKGEVDHAKAIINARKEYKNIRSDFFAARQENLDKASMAVIPERMKISLLKQYYLYKKKFFSTLDKKYP